MPPLWTNSLLTASTITATPAEDSSYPDSWAGTLDSHPLIRTTRSQNLNQFAIVFDYASTKQFRGFALFNTNFRSVTVAHSANNSAYTTIANVRAPELDEWDGFVKVFHQATFANRYIRLTIPTQGTYPNPAAYFELGYFGAFDNIYEFPVAPNIPMQRNIQTSFIRSGEDMAPGGGPLYLTDEYQMIIKNGQSSQMKTIVRAGEHKPFLWYNNLGNTQEVYLFRYSGGMRFQRGLTHIEVNPTFRTLA